MTAAPHPQVSLDGVDAPVRQPPPESVDGQDRRARQERIRELVSREGFVRIDELARDFTVSPMTIHRDLDSLQSEGWLRKVRGGATSEPSNLFHGSVRHRLLSLGSVKAGIAAHALELVTPGQSVILDDSTTVLRLARLLPARAPLVAVTNFLPAIKLLAGRHGIDVVALGGRYYPAYDAFLGLGAVEAVRSLRADVLFMSTTAVTDGVCYHTSTETVQVKRALMDAAATSVLLVDHTKFERSALHVLAPLSEFDLVVVDSGVSPERVARMRAEGVTVAVAPPLPASAADADESLLPLMGRAEESTTHPAD